MRRLRARLASDARRPLPVLIAGDLNATENTPQFRALLDVGYADAGDQAGAGPLPTYPTDRAVPALLGLDHVLTRHAAATSATTSELPGSDHRALCVHLVLATR
jgi:endonuclease/exonuclease/phosphatase (EEP) superfamily protein YafD